MTQEEMLLEAAETGSKGKYICGLLVFFEVFITGTLLQMR